MSGQRSKLKFYHPLGNVDVLSTVVPDDLGYPANIDDVGDSIRIPENSQDTSIIEYGIVPVTIIMDQDTGLYSSSIRTQNITGDRSRIMSVSWDWHENS